MKRFFYTLIGFLFISITINAAMRMGGTIAPDPSAMLDLNPDNTNNATRGLVLPRVQLQSTILPSPLADHVKGMFVYNTVTTGDVSEGIYYNDGSKWIKASAGSNMSINDVDINFVNDVQVHIANNFNSELGDTIISYISENITQEFIDAIMENVSITSDDNTVTVTGSGTSDVDLSVNTSAVGDNLVNNNSFVTNLGDELTSNTTFVTNLGDSIAANFSKTVLGDTIANYLLSNNKYITNLIDSVKVVLGDDENTLYTAGYGLELDGTEFSANMEAVADSLVNDVTYITNLGDELTSNTTFVTNLGDELVTNNEFITKLGDEFITNETFITNITEAIDLEDTNTHYKNGYALYMTENDTTFNVNMNIVADSLPKNYAFVNNLNKMSWSLTGNAGTDPNTHFIGTTDANKHIIFKVNNTFSGILSCPPSYGTTVGNNNSFGYKALGLYQNGSGMANNAFGQYALGNNGGNLNSAFGHSALAANTNGMDNTAMGAQALYSNTYGSYNTSVGSNALSQNISGSNNVTVGTSAGSNITTGSNNIAVGSGAQVPSPTASEQLSIGNWIFGVSGNIGIGVADPTAKIDVNGTVRVRDLAINATMPSGSQVVIADANGVLSKVDASVLGDTDTNTTYSAETGLTTELSSVGADVGFAVDMNAVANNSTIITKITQVAEDNDNDTQYTAGDGLDLNVTEFSVDMDEVADNLLSNNKFVINIGDSIALHFSETALGDTIINRVEKSAGMAWSLTGNARTNSDRNFIGTTDRQALMFKVDNQSAGFISYNPSSGVKVGFNNAFGYLALGANRLQAGMNNNAYGFKALEKNAGNQNNAFGNEALTNNLNGTGNTAIGHAALRNNTSGSNNNAFGYDALGANEYGISNNAIGYGALKSNRSGSNNIGIGDNAGNSITTGSNNIVIGYTANVPDGTADNQISIGNLIYGIEATNLLGTGKIGIGTVAPTEKLDIDGKVKVRDLVTNATIPTGSQVIIADANGVLAKVDAGGLLPAPTDDEIAAGDTILVWNETERKWGAGKLPTGMQSGDWIYCPPFKLEWEAGKTFDAELNLFTKFSTKLSNKLPNFNSSNYTFELMDFESEGINSIDIDENGGLIYTCTDYEPVYLDFVTIIIVKK